MHKIIPQRLFLDNRVAASFIVWMIRVSSRMTAFLSQCPCILMDFHVTAEVSAFRVGQCSTLLAANRGLDIAGIVYPWPPRAAGAVMRDFFVDDGGVVAADLLCRGVHLFATAGRFFHICNGMQCSCVRERECSVL
jgi:hypothetical protein